jgi:predicted phage terminase large subunit-like protein
MLDNAKREPRTWSALYQQQPRPIGGGEFKNDWLLYYMRAPATSNKILLVDPSSGKSRTRGDYTSMWVVGRGADGNDYVIDGIRDRLNLTERTEALFTLVRRHKPAAVGYEQYGMQSDIEHIRLEQERQQYRFRIIELGGATKKEDRIRRLIPSYQQGRIWMPQSIKRQMADGNTRDVMDDFRAEYSSFPVGSHDDALDCLARKEEPEMKKYLQAPNQDDDDSLGSGWEPIDREFNY